MCQYLGETTEGDHKGRPYKCICFVYGLFYYGIIFCVALIIVVFFLVTVLSFCVSFWALQIVQALWTLWLLELFWAFVEFGDFGAFNWSLMVSDLNEVCSVRISGFDFCH